MKLTVSFVLDDKADIDLLLWLKKAPANTRSAAIRDALREHLRKQTDLMDVYQAVLRVERLLARGVSVNTNTPDGDGDSDNDSEFADDLAAIGQ